MLKSVAFFTFVLSLHGMDHSTQEFKKPLPILKKSVNLLPLFVFFEDKHEHYSDYYFNSGSAIHNTSDDSANVFTQLDDNQNPVIIEYPSNNPITQDSAINTCADDQNNQYRTCQKCKNQTFSSYWKLLDHIRKKHSNDYI